MGSKLWVMWSVNVFTLFSHLMKNSYSILGCKFFFLKFLRDCYIISKHPVLLINLVLVLCLPFICKPFSLEKLLALFSYLWHSTVQFFNDVSSSFIHPAQHIVRFLNPQIYIFQLWEILYFWELCFVLMFLWNFVLTL